MLQYVIDGTKGDGVQEENKKDAIQQLAKRKWALETEDAIQ